MATKIKLLTILATLLIAAAGVMTFEACNKKDKGSVEPAAQNKNPQDATVSYLDDSGYNVNISSLWTTNKLLFNMKKCWLILILCAGVFFGCRSLGIRA